MLGLSKMGGGGGGRGEATADSGGWAVPVEGKCALASWRREVEVLGLASPCLDSYLPSNLIITWFSM